MIGLLRITAATAVLALLASCGGGGGGGSGGAAPAAPTTPTAGTTGTTATTSGSTVPTVTGPNLTAAEATTVALQAGNEARARSLAATIAVVDRVGNVLLVHQMPGASATATVTGGRGVTGGLEGAVVPSTLAAIAKAVSGAFLSSSGNAFSTRTASQIVQDHFNPLTRNTEGGPLFGVQFSQLPCSDVSRSFTAASMLGPKRSPFGLSADPGGFPLYKDGQVVGGVGVIADATYSADLDISNFDRDVDELIALAGTVGFDAPADIRANLISIGGLTLRYSDVTASNLATAVSASGTLNPVAVAGYTDGTVRSGTVFGTVASGIRPDDGTIFGTRNQVYVLDTGAGAFLFPPRAGLAPTGNVIGRQNAIDMVREALAVAYSARAAIRRPQGSFVNVTVTAVDLDGNILAMGSTNDPPVFGIDVSAQKARSAAFFSRTQAQSDLSSASAAVQAYVTPIRTLLGQNGFADGIAFSARAIGNLARPYYPDGIDGNGPGPLSLPFAQWSPFKTGLQLDLVAGDIVALAGGGAAPAVGCAGAGSGGLAATLTGGRTRLANGLQIFAGGVPIYSGTTVVGGLGVSGDGIDQDDMIAFLGLQNGGGAFGHAPTSQRSDQLTPGGTRLRYVNCPFTPFLNSTVQNPC